MATTAHTVTRPYVLKTAQAIFTRAGAEDADDFSDHIGEVTLTPTSQSGSWTGITGKTISDQGIATWAATLGLIQDLDDNGLLRWLLQHEGEKATLALTLATGADTITIDVTLSPSQIGGAVGPNPLSGSVTLAVDGKPVWS